MIDATYGHLATDADGNDRDFSTPTTKPWARSGHESGTKRPRTTPKRRNRAVTRSEHGRGGFRTCDLSRVNSRSRRTVLPPHSRLTRGFGATRCHHNAVRDHVRSGAIGGDSGTFRHSLVPCGCAGRRLCRAAAARLLLAREDGPHGGGPLPLRWAPRRRARAEYALGLSNPEIHDPMTTSGIVFAREWWARLGVVTRCEAG